MKSRDTILSNRDLSIYRWFPFHFVWISPYGERHRAKTILEVMLAQNERELINVVVRSIGWYPKERPPLYA